MGKLASVEKGTTKEPSMGKSLVGSELSFGATTAIENLVPGASAVMKIEKGALKFLKKK